ASFFKTLEKGKIGTNVIHQVPHNDVRRRVLGNANRAPTPDELTKMEALVEQAMTDGAWGLSTGLIYNPGTYAKTDELIALAKVAARHGGLYASHIRDEGTAVLAALEEILEIARRAGGRIHISPLQGSGPPGPGQAPARLRPGGAWGGRVPAAQPPPPASSTSRAALVTPPRFREGTRKDFLKRLDDPEVGPKVRKAIEERIDGRQGGKTLRIAAYAPKA